MNLEQFINSPQLKYAVITKASYDADETAQSISQAPRVFTLNDVEYVLLSICAKQAASFYAYLQNLGAGVDFEMIQHTGNVKLLLHNQVQDILTGLDDDNE
jgi:hypothetical protein